jgi:two-component system cell cycle sensor histidine kinase/response regulator CckA
MLLETAAESIPERYRILVETIPHMVWMARQDGSMFFLNSRTQANLGVTEDSILGWSWLQLVHPDDRGDAAEAWKKALSAKVAFRSEYRLHQGDDGYRSFLSQGVPVLDHDGNATWVGTWTDIDDLKHAREDLARDAGILRLRDRAIQAVTQGILITDPNLPDNPIVYSSPGFERITGYSAGEVVGRNCRFLQGKDTDRNSSDRIGAAISARESCRVELINYRKNGESFWNELSVAPVRDDQGTLTHFVGIQTDVTQRHNLDIQYRQAQKMEAIGQLACGVAHDFNNLLTVINGYAEMALMDLGADDPMRNSLEQILSAGGRSAGLTNQLLAFGRQQVLALRVLDLNGVILGFETMLLRILGENVVLKTVLAPDLGRVLADQGQIEQILLNLTVNARDAMPHGGTVTIETGNVEAAGTNAGPVAESPELPRVLLRFSDTGCGLTDQVRARLFEPFFTTKEIGKGTGLGMAVVHGIVSQSQGTIEVSSAVGQGTSFQIFLPCVNCETIPERIERPIRSTLGHETILLVEDDNHLRELLHEVLRRSGYHVLEAANGQAALEIAARTSPIHLLLTDVVMPVLGGRLLAEQIVPLHPEIHVLYLSGHTTDSVIRNGILEDDVHFLQKPFSTATLNRKLREVLEH